MKQIIAPLAILAIALTGCSGNTEPPAEPQSPDTTAQEVTQPESTPEPSPESTPEVWGHGTYQFAAGGTAGTITIPSNPPVDLAALSDAVDAPPSTYVTVHVDNRQGAQDAGMYEVHVFTPAGKKYVFQSVSSVLDFEWPAAPDAAYNQSIDVYNKYLNGASIGEVKDIPMIGVFPALPEEIARVAIYPFGAFEAVEAYPEDKFEELSSQPTDTAPAPESGLLEGTPEAEWLAGVKSKYPDAVSMYGDEGILLTGELACLHFDFELPASDLAAEIETFDEATAYMVTTGIPVFCPEHEGKL